MSERSYSYYNSRKGKFEPFPPFTLPFFFTPTPSFLTISVSCLAVVTVERAFFREGSFETLCEKVSFKKCLLFY